MDNVDWALLQQVGLAVGTILLAAVYALRKLGVIKERQPQIEPRAEQMWRSEAEAQKSRADRLADEVEELRGKMSRMQGEIDVLKARPDLSDLLRHFDHNHQEAMSAIRGTLDALRDISVAVIPPQNIHDD